MKKLKDRLFGRENHRYINGGKGVISIFLALLMIPFIIQADALIESSRYHAVVSALEQIMDSAAMSTMSNYDSFLMKRFGLTAVGQESDPEQTYQNYVKSNLEGGKIAWDTEMIKLEGRYPLSDLDVLENAIVEAAKLSVPTEMGSDLVVNAIKQLLDKLKGLSGFTSMANATTSVANALGSVADAVSVFEDLRAETEKANGKKDTYNGKFDQLRTKTDELISALREVERKEQALRSAQEEALAANREGGEIRTRIQSLEQERARLERELKEAKESEEVTEEEYRDMEEERKPRMEEIDERLEELEKEQKSSNARISSANDAVNKRSGEVNAAREQVSKKRSEEQNAAREYAAAISELRASLKQCQKYSQDAVGKIGTVVSSCGNAVKDVKKIQIQSGDKDNAARREELEKENKELQKQLDDSTDLATSQELKKQMDWNSYLSDNLKNDTTYKDMEVETDNMFKVAGEETKAAADVLKDALKDYNEGSAGGSISALDGLYTRMNGFSADSVTTGFVLDRGVYYVEIKGFSTIEQIQGAISKVEKSFEDPADTDGEGIGFFSLIKGISKLMDGLFKINLFYDGTLDAVIKTSLIGDEENGIDKVIRSLGQVANDLREIASPDFLELSLSGKIEKIVDLVQHIGEAFNNIVNYVKQLVTGLINAIMQLLDNAYDKVLLAEFLNQSCANRITYTGSNLLTGCSFSEAGMGTATNEWDSIFLVGALSSLVNTIRNFGDGNSDMFVGAETEYLLKGSRSELVNQTMVFFDIYMFRMVIDLFHIFRDEEVKTIKSAVDAATLGAGGFIVWIIYILLEPFVDTLVLVNGARINLFKSWCYLTPTGIPTLIGRLTSLKLNDAQKDEIMEEYAAALHVNYYSGTSAAKDSKSPITFGYSNYMFLFLLATDNNRLLERFRNVMMLEARKKNESFDIGKTYTYISTEVKGKYKPFLSVAGIYTNFAFSGTKKQVRGY